VESTVAADAQLIVPTIQGDRPRTAVLTRTNALALVALVLVGLGLRLAWVFYVDTVPLGGDPSWYFSVAKNLAAGHGYVADHEIYSDQPILRQPTAFWPPAYPLLLAGVWKAFGVSIGSAKVLNALLSALTIPFVWMLGRRVFDDRAAWVAAGIYAVFPNGISWLPLLFPEALFTLIFAITLWVLVEPRFKAVPARAAFAAGILAGLAALTRGQGVVLLPVAVAFWILAVGWREASRRTALMIAGAVLLIAPWTVRNWITLGSPVLISTNAGVTLRIGHAADATGTTRWPTDAVDGIEAWQSPYYPDWEVRSYRVYTRRAITYAATHPREEADLARLKIYHLYRSDSGVIPWVTTLGVTPIEPRGLEDSLWWVFDVAYYGLVFGAVLTAPLWLKRDARRQLLLIVLVVWTLFHIMFQGEPRYHVPLFPIFAVAFGGGVIALGDVCRSKWRRLPG
jgi:4-amino-4-deoxy-L-arabinose transferase-like glycosyltransferase